MATFILQAGEEGLRIPTEMLEESGVRPGSLVELDCTPLPDAEIIQLRALRHVIRSIGGAVGVRAPVWVNGEWEVALVSPDARYQIGKLYLDPHGEVICERSDTHESALRAFDAVSAARSAA